MKNVILRSPDHGLVMAFECPSMDHFWPAMMPDVMEWGGRKFIFATMTEHAATYTQAFTFALIEGTTATQLSAAELAKIKNIEPEAA